MSAKSKKYSDQISDAQVMESGLRNNPERVSRRGLDEAFVNLLGTNRNDATTLNDEQEKLKAEKEMKTAELEAKLVELDVQMREARKVVKLEFPKEQWKEFGITDKR